MRSQRWSTLVSGLVFGLVLASTGSARAQWGYPDGSGYSGVNQYNLGDGAPSSFIGFPYLGSDAPSNFIGFPYLGSDAPSNFIGFPVPGYRLSTGQEPETTASFESVPSAVTLFSVASRSRRSVHRRNPAQLGVPRAAIRR